jgi:glyoxalase family protein
MPTPIRSLHHVTATVAEAQDDLHFATGDLGLRLVKRTVNFDNTGVYHFYYGDERGTPGTVWTTFPYKGMGVRVGQEGAGQITATSFSVPEGAVDFWKQRFAGRVEERGSPFGEEGLRLRDPSGLVIDLVAGSADPRTPWTGGGVTADTAVRGLHGVALTIRQPRPTVRFLTDVLGFDVINETGGRTRLAVNGDLPGHIVDIVHAPDAPPAVNGLGTVHHVAFAVADADEQLAIRRELLRLGVHVTEVLDRQYFHSIYFREPGGVLYEIATMQPGFTIDEEVPDLGRDLKLPPWEEPRRGEIEAALPELNA